MNRLIATLLIPFFVVGNAVAHSHGDAAHVSHSSARAHIHLSGDLHDHHHGHNAHEHSHSFHHHHHAEKSPEPTPVEPVEHDSTAVYLVAGESLFVPSECVVAKVVCHCFQSHTANAFNADNNPPRVFTPPLSCTSELPLYLRHSVLRL